METYEKGRFKSHLAPQFEGDRLQVGFGSTSGDMPSNSRRSAMQAFPESGERPCGFKTSRGDIPGECNLVDIHVIRESLPGDRAKTVEKVVHPLGISIAAQVSCSEAIF